MSGGESVVIEARALARILKDALLFTATPKGKDDPALYSAVELAVADGVAHCCASNGYAAGWSRAELVDGSMTARAVLDLVDAQKVANAVTPRHSPSFDNGAEHWVSLTFHGESLAVSMTRQDDSTEPDWSIDVRPSPIVDLFSEGQVNFANIPHQLMASGPSHDAGAAEWQAVANQLSLFAKVDAAKGDLIHAEMCAPATPQALSRLCRIRIGEFFTGGISVRTGPDKDLISGEVLPSLGVRAAVTESTYRRTQPEPTA